MIKKNGLKNIQKNYDSYSEGIDYGRVNLDGPISKFETLLEKLNLSNSKEANLNFKDLNLAVEKVGLNNGVGIKFSIPYKQTVVPLFVYAVYFDYVQLQFKTYGKLDLYGGFYRLQELGFFKYSDDELDFLKKQDGEMFLDYLYKNIGDLQLTRLDYRFDFFKKNDDIDMFGPKKVFTLRSNSKHRIWKKGEELQSWDIGNRKSKRVIIRGYNKLLDSESKDKFLLYADYFENKCVHRLEFEFLNHFIVGFTYNNIPKFLEKVKDYVEVNKKFKIYKTYDKTDLSDVLDRFKYVRLAKGYIKGCVDNGIDIMGIVDEVLNEKGFEKEEINNIFKEYLARKNIDVPTWDIFEKNNLDDLLTQNYGMELTESEKLNVIKNLSIKK